MPSWALSVTTTCLMLCFPKKKVSSLCIFHLAFLLLWKQYMLMWELKCYFDLFSVPPISGQMHNSRSFSWAWSSSSFSQKRLLSTVSLLELSFHPVLANPGRIKRTTILRLPHCLLCYSERIETLCPCLVYSCYHVLMKQSVAEGRWHFLSCWFWWCQFFGLRLDGCSWAKWI